MDVVNQTEAAVAAFVGEAEPSDNLTMLFLHYLRK